MQVRAMHADNRILMCDINEFPLGSGLDGSFEIIL